MYVRNKFLNIFLNKEKYMIIVSVEKLKNGLKN